jgi:AraC family transcriptional activator of pobA
MNKIGLDHLQDKTNLGVQIKPMVPSESFEEKARALGFHRDDHYIFLFLQAGTGALTVEMQYLVMEAGQLFYVLPGQVHYHIRAKDATGWFVAVDRALVPAGCRNIFEGRSLLQHPQSLSPSALAECGYLLQLLAHRYKDGTEGTRLYLPIVHALLQSFLWLAADVYAGVEGENTALSRPAELSRQFRRLLSEHFRILKNPGGYAARLHVSTSYLNEAVKGETGLPCSHWIKQEILMEAKRLLCYSDLNVKEISDELGYTDPAYFSRFFRRAAGMAALAFKELYRPSSVLPG